MNFANDIVILDEKNFDLIFNTANIGVAILSLEGTIVNVNKKICEILGYEKYELLGKTVKDVSFEEDIEKSYRFMREAIDGKQNNPNYEKRYYQKNGSLVWAQISNSLIYDDEQRPLFFLVYIIDITEQKISQIELIESEHKFNSCINLSPTPIFIVNSNGDIKFVNIAGFEQFAYNPDEILNMNLNELSNSIELDKLINTFLELIKNGFVKQELILQNKRMIGVDVILEGVKVNSDSYIFFCTVVTYI